MPRHALTRALCVLFVFSNTQGAGPPRIGSLGDHASSGSPQADTVLWSYRSDSDIHLFALHPLGVPRVFIATPDALLCLDAETGAARWTRADIKKLPAAGFVFVFYPISVDTTNASVTYGARGILTRGKGLEAIDLETGEKRWDSGAWGVSEVRGYLPVPGQTVLLVLAKTRQSKSSVLGVDLETGQVKWQSDTIFQKEPELLSLRVGSQLLSSVYASTLFGHQDPLPVSDSSLILYLSEDGPVRIDGGTGSVLWRGAALKGKEVPVLIEDYADLLAGDSIVFVPSENKLVALRAADGTAMWGEPPSYSRGLLTRRSRDWARVVGMRLTAHGLLVRVAKVNPSVRSWGDVSLDLLDPVTSRSRWPARIEDVTTWPVVRGDTAYLVTAGKLLAVDLPSGASRLVVTLEFRGGPPHRLRLRDGGIVVSGAQSHALVDYSGTIKYQKHYPTPGVGFFRAFAAAVAEQGTWSPRPQVTDQYVYLVTNAPDDAGRQGLSVVRLDQATGSEAGRVWLSGRPKSHDVDPATSTLFVQTSDREIMAYRF